MAKLPVVTPTQKFDIRFINGQPVFDLREQIINILTQDSKSGIFREFFAEPIVNHSKGEISWYSHGSGDVRPFAAITTDERLRISSTIKDIDQRLKSTAEKLSKASPQSAWIGDAMRSMLLVPNLEQSLFMVGDQPVLCQWGCVPFGSDPGDFDMVNQRFDIVVRDTSAMPTAVPEPTSSGGDLPEVVPPLAAMPEPPDTTEPPPPDEPPPPPEAPAPTAFDWRRLLPWLLALFLLLLLLLGLYLNYLYRHHYFVQDYSAEIARERVEIDRLWGAIEEKSRQCPAPVPPVDFSPTPVDPTPEQDHTNNGPTIDSDVVEDALKTDNISIGEEVNVSLAWTSPDDLDLAVTDPSGEVIFFRKRSSSTGGRLDVDAHSSCSSKSTVPVENISWNSLPLAGTYKVDVTLYHRCGNSNPDVPFTLIITRKDAPKKIIDGKLNAAQPSFAYEFTVGGR